MSKKLFLLACACCTLLQAKELVITSRVAVDDHAEAAVLEELTADSKALTRKYSDAEGVRSVETTVRCEVCGTAEKNDTRCNCGKPKPKCEECGNIAHDKDDADTAQDDSTKCNCGKPRPRSEESAECTECQNHTQADDKVAVNDAGEHVCSDCSETLRSCSSCCKKKCCKKCKKCCSKCSSCTTSSTCTSCCH